MLVIIAIQLETVKNTFPGIEIFINGCFLILRLMVIGWLYIAVSAPLLKGSFLQDGFLLLGLGMLDFAGVFL
ncbi:hypothetical protein VSS37_21775 [Candidatus Thiothrix sp. Deng01]|uniref:Uncharacterized protein n=1 Tax=Candidatus Thiothrix phosphatis TaxID=3112415 RepID=A0ABU6D5N3_9GAMM|nr:hypothetical protein [Candidatus Thiothrix sp. Deng01]MEB4593614.1 hypothetical protein [Candidatus Thiothrix sp. Deng01]